MLLDPGVRQAISELRSQGIVVVIVTGRILEDLRRAVSDLHFVDAIVAENGAVIEFPDSGYSNTFGTAPSAAPLGRTAARRYRLCDGPNDRGRERQGRPAHTSHSSAAGTAAHARIQPESRDGVAAGDQ